MNNWSEKKLKFTWGFICCCVFLLAGITFFTGEIAEGKIEPILLSMPFHLWVSILSTVLLVVLTALGGFVFYQLKTKSDPTLN